MPCGRGHPYHKQASLRQPIFFNLPPSFLHSIHLLGTTVRSANHNVQIRKKKLRWINTMYYRSMWHSNTLVYCNQLALNEKKDESALPTVCQVDPKREAKILSLKVGVNDMPRTSKLKRQETEYACMQQTNKCRLDDDQEPKTTYHRKDFKLIPGNGKWSATARNEQSSSHRVIALHPCKYKYKSTSPTAAELSRLMRQNAINM